jgi:hypothetical protein
VRLRVIHTVEHETGGRLHSHAAIGLPKHISPAEFEQAVKKCWYQSEWGDCRPDAVKIKYGADQKWVSSYLLKLGQKSGLETWVDCIDWGSFYNPITGA